jgi:hypothetical protein
MRDQLANKKVSDVDPESCLSGARSSVILGAQQRRAIVRVAMVREGALGIKEAERGVE